MADGPNFLVTMKTGNEPGAGTDGDVYVKLISDGGTVKQTISDEVKLNVEGNDFEQGDSWTYNVHSNKTLNNLTHIEVRLDLINEFGNAWNLESLQVEDANTHKLWQARTEVWFNHTQGALSEEPVDTRVHRFLLSPVKTARYRFEIATGKSWGAGTDGYVYLRVRGNPLTEVDAWINIDGPGNDFERGARAWYGPYTCPVRTPPEQLDVRLELKVPGDAWQINWIAVEDTATGARYNVDVNQWLEGPPIVTGFGRVEKSYRLLKV